MIIQWQYAVGLCVFIILAFTIYTLLLEENSKESDKSDKNFDSEDIHSEKLGQSENLGRIVLRKKIKPKDSEKSNEELDDFTEKQNIHELIKSQQWNERNRQLNEMYNLKFQEFNPERIDLKVSDFEFKPELNNDTYLTSHRENKYKGEKRKTLSDLIQPKTRKSPVRKKIEHDKDKDVEKNVTISQWSSIDKSNFERLCSQILANVTGLDFETVRIEEIKNPLTNKPLEIDAFNRKTRIGMEVQGPQHSEFPNYIEYDPLNEMMLKQFKERVARDEYKRQKCFDLGIKLIEIPFSIEKEDLEEYMLEQLSNVGVHIEYK